jgi:hypothetical protein
MRSMRVKIDLAHDQMEVAGQKIPLQRATVGPKSPDGPLAAEMSVEGRTELEARGEPPPKREWTEGEAKESLLEGQRTLGGGCDPQAPRQPLQDDEGEMSVEERQTDGAGGSRRTAAREGRAGGGGEEKLPRETENPGRGMQPPNPRPTLKRGRRKAGDRGKTVTKWPGNVGQCPSKAVTTQRKARGTE